MKNYEIKKLWDKFNDIARKYGYDVITYDNNMQGKGTTTYQKDPYVPMICLSITNEIKREGEIVIFSSLDIFVKDRNGASVLDGDWCAVYRLPEGENKCNPITLSFKEVHTKDFEKKFLEMCEYAFVKWSGYSKINRLDFKYNNFEIERINLSKK